MTSAKRLCLSLEPPPPTSSLSRVDSSDPFSLPPRLFDVDVETGIETYSADAPGKSVGERLQRIWMERGDFSLVTEESILHPVAKKEDEADKGDGDTRPTPDQMRELQRDMFTQLETARVELQTALDLLSVISPAPPAHPSHAQNPPIAPPLPHQSLRTLTTSAPLPSVDPALPLATSLSSIKSNANAFLSAFTSLDPSSSTAGKQDPWPTLLHLQTSTAYPLVPLGAQRGATLTGRGESRAARNVGVFFGAPEGKEEWRRRAVLSSEELLRRALRGKEGEGEGGKKEGARGRRLVCRVEWEGKGSEEASWADGEDEGVMGTLGQLAKQVFAEEMFATLVNEAKSDQGVKATLEIASKATSITTVGHGWSLTFRMVSSTSTASSTPSSPLPTVLLSLLRILFLQDYSQRRRPPSTLLWARPFLQTFSVLMSHLQRVEALRFLVQRLVDAAGEGEVDGVLTSPSGGMGHVARWVQAIMKGERELGGLITLRMRAHVFHVSHSLPLPAPPSQDGPGGAFFPTQSSLLLQSGAGAMVPVPSLVHLETFWGEMIREVQGGKQNVKGER